MVIYINNNIKKVSLWLIITIICLSLRMSQQRDDDNDHEMSDNTDMEQQLLELRQRHQPS